MMDTADVDETKSKVQVIIDALGKADAVQMVDFDVAKCSSELSLRTACGFR